jgi:hypothetical protein
MLLATAAILAVAARGGSPSAAAAATAAAAVDASPAAAAEPEEKAVAYAGLKNVLFLVSDDFRPSTGKYGVVQASTPNLDRLVEQGLLFTAAHVQQAYCAPSRNSFMSGRRPDTNKVGARVCVCVCARARASVAPQSRTCALAPSLSCVRVCVLACC